MYYTRNTMPPTKPPVTLRLDDEHRGQLERLAQASSPSDVLRRGLRLVADTELASDAPMYPRLVDDEDVDEVIEDATRAACDVLQQLFPDKGPELHGISSNFQGTLKEHLQAMLAGRPAATWSHRRHLNALLGDGRSLGSIRSAATQEGYSLTRLPTRHGDEPVYFDSDSARFVPLERVSAGSLFTSPEAAVREAFAWMQAHDVSPRQAPLRLCLLSFAHDGPLRLVDIAR